MTRTLYISDLDGTLLNNSAELTQFAREKLALLKSRAVAFTCASARTVPSAKRILGGCPLGAPAVLMNGANVYDFAEGRFVNVEYIGAEDYARAHEILQGLSLEPMVYCLQDGRFVVPHGVFTRSHVLAFRGQREASYGEAFVEKADISEEKNVFYIVTIGLMDELEPARERLSAIPGLTVFLYEDIYNKNYLLEVSSSSATKRFGADFLRGNYGFDRLVGFGDNHNDLDLLAACDHSYAVGNAVDAVKAAADEVIGTNTEDAVVKKILELEGLM